MQLKTVEQPALAVAMPPPPAERPRLEFLDGIRGWASLMVLFSHLIACFLAASTPEYRTTYLRFPTDGALAVYVFFVLSGFVLRESNIRSANLNLVVLMATRYLRLLIPILAMSVLVYLLLRFHLMYNTIAAPTPTSPGGWWLCLFYKFGPSIRHMLRFAFYDVFFHYSQDVSYNSSLWTMPNELLGSFLVYILASIRGRHTTVNWGLIGAGLFFWLIGFTIPVCFVVGFFIADLYRNSQHIVRSRVTNGVSAVLFLIVIVLVTMRDPREPDNLFLMSTGLVLAVTYSSLLRRFFSSAVSRFLGRISFPLYLLQIPIICSWSSYLFIRLDGIGLSRLQASNIILVSTVLFCLIASVLFRPVEVFAIRYSKRTARSIYGVWQNRSFLRTPAFLAGAD